MINEWSSQNKFSHLFAFRVRSVSIFLGSLRKHCAKANALFHGGCDPFDMGPTLESFCRKDSDQRLVENPA